MNYLNVENISKSYGEVTLFEGVSFSIHKGQKIAFIAKNGTGKSTLLRVLAGLEGRDSGIVAFNKDIHVEFLNQEPTLNPDRTVFQEVYESDNPKLKAVKEYEDAMANPEDEEAFNNADKDFLKKIKQWNAAKGYEFTVNEAKNRSIPTSRRGSRCFKFNCFT